MFVCLAFVEVNSLAAYPARKDFGSQTVPSRRFSTGHRLNYSRYRSTNQTPICVIDCHHLLRVHRGDSPEFRVQLTANRELAKDQREYRWETAGGTIR